MSRFIGLASVIVATALTAGCGARTPTDWAECGNGEPELGEDCDGANLRGLDCADLGYTGGTLGCSDRCTYETTACNGTGPQCGNGVQELGEACDGVDLAGQTCSSLGLPDGQLGCSPHCDHDTSQCNGSDPNCGDGVVNPPQEQCDGAALAGMTCETLGFDDGQLSCSPSCTYDTALCVTTQPVCGDGVVNPPQEQCDGAALAGMTCVTLGFDGGQLSCSPSCTYDTALCVTTQPVCGDGVVNTASEQCDGADLQGLTCVDLGYTGGTLQCNASCGFDTSGCVVVQAFCGDGWANTALEDCDGFDLQGLTCQALGFAGGTLQCDAGCAFDTSGCTSVQPFCGDGVVNTTWEQCDGADLQGVSCIALGYDGGTLSCSGSCLLDESQCTLIQPLCGDGIVNTALEQCDGADLQGMDCFSLGYDGGTLSCDGACLFDESLCTLIQPICGDGVVNAAAEQCDGADLQGATCQSLGLGAGTLSCTSGCQYDTGGCSTTASCSPTGGTVYCDSGNIGTTVGSPSLVSHWTDCGATGLTGPETVYEFTLPAGMPPTPVWVGLYQLSAALDVVVLQATGWDCDPDGTCQVVMDNPGLTDEGDSFYAYSGVTYYIIVDGHAGASGDYVLAIGCFSP